LFLIIAPAGALDSIRMIRKYIAKFLQKNNSPNPYVATIQ